jgi:hypothetical protein
MQVTYEKRRKIYRNYVYYYIQESLNEKMKGEKTRNNAQRNVNIFSHFEFLFNEREPLVT